jgi:hypothetical protein
MWKTVMLKMIVKPFKVCCIELRQRLVMMGMVNSLDRNSERRRLKFFQIKLM